MTVTWFKSGKEKISTTIAFIIYFEATNVTVFVE